MPVAPPVGIVVANHNNDAFVERAIESVARQSVRDLQVVVVDDASTDSSDEAIRRGLARHGDTRFRYVRLEHNLGQAGALMAGMAELETPFVCFLDSDDAWYEGFVAGHLAAHLNADFPVALTYCDSHIIDGDDRLLAGTAWWFDSNEPEAQLQHAISRDLVPSLDPASGAIAYPANPRLTFHPQWTLASATNTTASMMFRRSFLDLVFVPPSDQLRLYVDFYLATFALLLTGVVAIHAPLYAYRMHGRNKHSNATVPGGPYNSSMREWEPIRNETLKTIQTVLRREAALLRLTFGNNRHDQADAAVVAVIGDPDKPEPVVVPRGRLSRLFGTGSGNAS
jgi:glycosyltransferase involved in cell wall biosynthesis